MKNIIIVLILLFQAGCVLFGPTVRAPVSDVPFTYEIGWWPNQEYLEVTGLNTRVIDSRLGLSNSKSLVGINIRGTMKTNGGWKPYISSVHISEKAIEGGSFSSHEAVIQVTPIIDSRKDDSYNGEILAFDINQELVLHSMGWGKNTYLITSQGHKQTVELHQQK